MLKLVECIFKIICTCLTCASCFATYKMKSYCLKCRKYIENIDPEISSSSNGRAIIYQSRQYVAVKIEIY